MALATALAQARGCAAVSGWSKPILTYRQLEILLWVRADKSAWEIGQILGVSNRTVEGHLRRIYRRLGVHSRLQAVLAVEQLGLLPSRSAADHQV